MMRANAVEDDFGRPVRRRTCKALGIFQPCDSIGASLTHLPQPAETKRKHLEHEFDNDDTYLEMGALTIPEPTRDWSRLKKTVFDDGGKAVTSQRPSSGNGRTSGVKQMDHLPNLQKGPMDGSKRCFPWSCRPTGYQNPVSYEDPPVPGVRPSHPVPAVGLVSLGHRRAFPEKEVKTSIPPRSSKAPTGSEWGGWAKNGAPGRAPLDRPWEVETDAKNPDGLRVTDARIRQFVEMKNPPTAHHTQWHTDARNHIDPVKQSRVHHSEPLSPVAPSGSLTERGEMHMMLNMRGAGKPTGSHVEGAALPFYDRFRAEEAASLSAR